MIFLCRRTKQTPFLTAAASEGIKRNDAEQKYAEKDAINQTSSYVRSRRGLWTIFRELCKRKEAPARTIYLYTTQGSKSKLPCLLLPPSF